MTVFMLLTRLRVQSKQFSCPRIQEEPFPRETARIQTKQVAILAGEWLYKLVDGAKPNGHGSGAEDPAVSKASR
jgi:hypothetical protein